MRRDDIRAMVQSWGKGKFVRVFAALLEGRSATGEKIPKLRAEDVSLRALWEGLVGPVDETLDSAKRAGAFNYLEMQEAIDATAFPSATGVLIASRVIEGYSNAEGMIGDEMVTVMQSRLKSERVVGFTSLEGPEEVAESMPYAESSFEEKYVTTETAKKGRILEITEEAIYFDQTGQILMRASRLGEMIREEREEIIVAGVLDVGGSSGLTVGGRKYRTVYRPGGTATTLYSTGNLNLVGSSTPVPLVDWTDIDEAMLHHAENIRDDRAVSGERRPIIWMPKVLLVARKKAATGARILSATEVRSGDITSGAGDQTISGNPLKSIVGNLRVLSSPLMDYLAGVSGSQYNDSDDWFLGDPKRQFVWQEIWPLQTFRAVQDDEARFRRDIVSRLKARYYGGFFALDHRHMLKVNAAA